MSEPFHGHVLRTRVYIDGYNLYYGCLKGTAFKWLDLLALFEKRIIPSALLEHNGKPLASELLPVAVKFFTAKIIEKAAKAPDSVASQAHYHSALRKFHQGRVEVIEGYYSLIESKAKIVDAEAPRKWPRDCSEILVWKLEEKQSDVNLALQLYHDAMSGQIDHAIVATNDTDIAPALAMLRKHTLVKIGLVIPTRNRQRVPNAALQEHVHWCRRSINDDELRATQLPRVIVGGRQPTLKPDTWYAQPALFKSILKEAIQVKGSRTAAFKWMEAPNSYLDDQRPIELAETEEGAAQVMRYITSWGRQKTALD